MATYTRAEIITKIVVKMDELTPIGTGLIISNGNTAVLPVKDYAESILNETFREHLRNCPFHKVLPACIATYASVTCTTPGTTTIILTKPADYIKNHLIKFIAWKRAVTKTITPDNPLYKLQGNDYTKGGQSKPVVVEFNDYLEATTAAAITGTGTVTSYVKYIAPEAITVGAVYAEETVDMLSWLAASKILALMGDEKYKLAYESYGKILNS